jgi:hypothetical protein
MYRNMMIVAGGVALLWMASLFLMQSGSDARMNEREQAIATAEAKIMTALRARDHVGAQRGRDELFQLFPGNDSRAHQIYDHCIERVQFERSRADR